MEYTLTTAGLDTTAAAVADEIAAVGVGTGNSAVTKTDTALEAEIHREQRSHSSVSVEPISQTGTIRVAIVVIGGLTVPPETDIYELGLFDTDGALLYRQVSEQPRETGDGQSLQIESELTIAPLVR